MATAMLVFKYLAQLWGAAHIPYARISFFLESYSPYLMFNFLQSATIDFVFVVDNLFGCFLPFGRQLSI
jgi:hypothetical protein